MVLHGDIGYVYRGVDLLGLVRMALVDHLLLPRVLVCRHQRLIRCKLHTSGLQLLVFALPHFEGQDTARVCPIGECVVAKKPDAIVRQPQWCTLRTLSAEDW